MFWDQYHYDSDDHNDYEDYEDYHDYHDYEDYGSDVVCEYKGWQGTSADFSTLGDYTWNMYLSYNPCDETTFYCEFIDETGTITDCAQSFGDGDFWYNMRDDEFWTRSESQQYWDFYNFWECHHGGPRCEDWSHDYDDYNDGGDSGHDDYHDYNDYNDYDVVCGWKDWYGTCSDFSYHRESGFECDWVINYDPCNEDEFYCSFMY